MIQTFLINLVLAALYMALTGDTSFLSFVVGFVIGFLIVWFAGKTSGHDTYPGRMLGLLWFAGYFVKILIKANFDVAWEIITPGMHMTPRMIKYPVHGMNAVQVTWLANAITLTPGTLTTDIDDAGEHLYIHCMYAQDRDKAVADLDELRDKLLRGVFGL